jgi:glycosyltransferase involved in cell wall biosynthesis
MILDFDDAIWIPVTSEYNKAASRLRNFSKTSRICRWSYKVSVGNTFLAEYAGRFSKQVVIIPTVVEVQNRHNRLQDQQTAKPAIGWTGTFSTLKYLEIVMPTLRRLQEEVDFTFIVIADKDPQLPLKNYRFIKWKQETEIDDLLTFHIGLMPLYDDDISKGKCGFKAIQYMSLGIPAIVSPVGVNCDIVDDGKNGFVCEGETEWYDRMSQLIRDPFLRQRMGIEARKKIEDSYSVTATRDQFISLFR